MRTLTNEIVVILGRKGSGKTYLARRLLADKRRLIAFDPKCQLSDMGVVIRDPFELIEYIKANFQGSFRVIYQPDVDIYSDGSLYVEFQNVVATAYYTKDLYLFLDEIYLYTTRSKRGNILENIINSGRHD
jgi:predicted AAA+ superfamily ATPase